MSKVVNLNKFRKRKAQVEREKRAETNRRLHGRTRSERDVDELRKRQLKAKLDAAFLVKPPGNPDDER